jgi:hypothetical protein
MDDYQKQIVEHLEKLKKVHEIQNRINSIEAINKELGHICEELGDFTKKIEEVAKNNGELSASDAAQIDQLNKRYNDKMKELRDEIAKII